MNIEAKLTRPELWSWLEQREDPFLVAKHGEGSSFIVKIPKDAEIDYLFGNDSYYGDSIGWRDRLYFCGLYERQWKSVYMAKSTLSDLVDGLTAVEQMDCDQLPEYIATQVNQMVEGLIENDRTRLQVKKLTSPDAVSALRFYRRHTAESDAIERFMQRAPAPIQFRSCYSVRRMSEGNLLAYIRDPETFIREAAERYMQETQENFLLQFLENDSVEKKYQALLQNDEHPIHLMRDITEAVEACGGKTVSVSVQKDGKELTFKTSASALKGYHDTYALNASPFEDHERFEEVFGMCAKYSAADITRITYRHNTIYEAPQVQRMDHGMRMKGM